MADGSFKIKTEIDVKQAEKSVATLSNRIMSLTSTIDDYEKKLESIKDYKLSSDEYEIASKNIKKTEVELNKLIDRQMQMEALGKSSGSAWDNLRYKIEELKESLYYQKGELGYADEFNNLEQAIASAKSELELLKSEMNSQQESIIPNVNITPLQNTIQILKNTIRSVPSMLGKLALSIVKIPWNAFTGAIKRCASAISGAFVGACKRAVSSVSNLGKSLVKLPFKFIGKSLGLFKKTSDSAFNLKSILKYAFGIRSLFVLVNRLRSALVDGMNNLAQFNNGVNPVNASLSRLKSALTQLKNSLATAFAPILTTIELILTKLINKLSQAVTMVGMFIAKLTGAKSFTKAVAVQENYAESLSGTSKGMDKTAKSAKKAQKAVEGYLSPIDEINKMTKQNDDSDDSILPDVTDAGGGLSPNDMFETVEIPDSIGNLVDKLKEMWANADFTELGAFIGQKLKDALDSIPWDKIKETATKIGKSIATLLNGFFEVDGLGKTIGKTIGEALNTVVNLINGFVTNFHWKSLGQFLADGINGLVDSIDWKKLGQTINIGFKGVLEFFQTAIEETDWLKMGESLRQALNEIDWIGIIEGIFYTMGEAVGGLALLLQGLIGEEWQKLSEWWYDVAFENGKFTIAGLYDGIIEAISDIFLWIEQHIFNPFMDGFRKIFGINSPSTVMHEQGVYIIQGLLNGIESLIHAVQEKWETIKTAMINKMHEAKEKVTQKFQELKANATTKMEEAKANIQEKASQMKETLVTKFSEMKQSASEKLAEIKNTIVENMKDARTTTAENLADMKATWDTKWDSFFDKIKDVWDKITSTISGAIEKIKGWIDSAMEKINNLKEKASEMGANFKSGVSSVVSFTKSIFGGSGISIPKINIPKYATGQVIPTSMSEHLAILGDNKHETEVVSPLSTMKQALSEVLSMQGSGSPIVVQVMLDSKVVAESVVNQGKLRQASTGQNMFAF